MDAVPGPVHLPTTEVVKHDTVRREVVRQTAPDAAVACLIKDRVHDFATRVLRGPPAGLGSGDQRSNGRPLIIGQVGRIRRPCHAPQDKTTGATRLPYFLDTLLDWWVLRQRASSIVRTTHGVGPCFRKTYGLVFTSQSRETCTLRRKASQCVLTQSPERALVGQSFGPNPSVMRGSIRKT